MYRKLFPELTAGTWRHLDLGYLASLFCPSDRFPQNPLIDPKACQEWIDHMHKLWHIDYSFGGHLEDRVHLWRGSHLTDGVHAPAELAPSGNSWKTIHLGIDFNVPVGTVVHTPLTGRVIDVKADTDIEGGWGGRVIVEYVQAKDHSVTLVYGHLSFASLPQLDTTFAAGDVVGVVGNYPENGNWFPHLHVQRLNLYAESREWVFANLNGYTYRRNNIRDIYPLNIRDFCPEPSCLLL